MQIFNLLLIIYTSLSANMEQLNTTQIVEKTIEVYQKSIFYTDNVKVYNSQDNQQDTGSNHKAEIKIFFKRDNLCFKYLYVENNSSLPFVTCIFGKNNIFRINDDLLSEKGSYTTLENIKSAVQNSLENQYILPLLITDINYELHPFKTKISLEREEILDNKSYYKLTQEIHKEITKEDVKTYKETLKNTSIKVGFEIPIPNLGVKKYVEKITYWIDKTHFYIKKIEKYSNDKNTKNVLIFNPTFNNEFDEKVFDD